MFFDKESLKSAFQIIFTIFIVFLLLNTSNSNFKKTNLSVSKEVNQSTDVVYKYCLSPENAPRGKESCYSKEFRILAEENGPFFSFDVLHNLQKVEPEAVGCHLMAHAIGKGSYNRDPKNWRTLIQNMDSSCSYGAIHGVLEAYIGSLPERSLKRDIIPTICGESPRADCNHIIGHMLLVETDADVNKALNLCEVFKDVQQNSFCISGVFMEYQTAVNLVQHELVPESWMNWPARLPALEKLCRSFSGKYAAGCWEEIVHVAVATFDGDAKKVFDFCNTAQVEDGVKRCKRHSLGIIGASKNFDLDKLKYICSLQEDIDPNFKTECYPALVSSSLSTIPSALPEAISFCNSLEDDYKQSCFIMVGNVGVSNPVVREELPKACKKVKSTFRNFCTGDASVGMNFTPQSPNI